MSNNQNNQNVKLELSAKNHNPAQDSIPFHIFREKMYSELNENEPLDLGALTLAEKIAEEWIRSAYALYIAARLTEGQNVREREIRLARHFNDLLFERFLGVSGEETNWVNSSLQLLPQSVSGLIHNSSRY